MTRWQAMLHNGGVRRLMALPAVLAALALVAAACGGGGEPEGAEFPDVVTLGEGEVFPVITNSALAVGQNRLSLGLLDKENTPILDAEVHLRFFDLGGDEPVLKSEADARFIPVELFFIDEASGKEKRFVGSNGVYVVSVTFDRAGPWGLEVAGTIGGEEIDPVPFRFDVHEAAPEVAVGDPAPPSRQVTLSEARGIREIDSSQPPRPEMHRTTVADALETGKPLLVAFATPAFCESRTCGPVMETVMDPLYDEYKDEAVFIHIEPFQLAELRSGTGRIPVQATADWGLSTEPWVFVVDRQGKVAAKFEGIVALEEVESALMEALEG